jgi:hypothetical protein
MRWGSIGPLDMLGLYWAPGHAGVSGKEMADELAKDGCVLKCAGPEPNLEVSRQDIRRRIRGWLVNQRCIWWRGLGDTQTKVRDLISGSYLGAKARFLFFNRTQPRAVTGLLTGHNTLRRHLHLMGQTVHCVGVEQRMKPLFHILCECAALASLRHMYLGPLFLEPETSSLRVWRPSGALVKQQSSHKSIWAQRASQ